MPLSVWLSWEQITVGDEQHEQNISRRLARTGGAHLWGLLWVYLQGEVLKGLHSGLVHFGRCHEDAPGKWHTVVIPAEGIQP